MIFISFVTEDPGKAIEAFKSYSKKKKVSVYFFYQSRYKERANQAKQILKSDPDVKDFILKEINFKNPGDLKEVYEKLFCAIDELNMIEEFRADEKIINIHAGTPTIRIAIVLLTLAGYIENGQLLQHFKPDFNKGVDGFKLIKMDIENFPSITKINELKSKIHDLTLTREGPIVGTSSVMMSLKEKIKKFAKYSTPVLVLGQTGTGKELVAREIHDNGNRKDKPFIAVNCGAIPHELVESELFGYIKGAFTDAKTDYKGYFSQANHGTIFLDEVADLPLRAQVKLLRVFTEKKIRPLKGEPEEIDVRIIAATNKDLVPLVKQGLFRHDLYYRLNVLKITAPPLIDRESDIQEIIKSKMIEKNEEFIKYKIISRIKTIHDMALEKLKNYNWPGNIRELENVLERAYVNSDDNEVIMPEHIEFDGIQNNELHSEFSEIMDFDYYIAPTFYNNALKKAGLNANEAAKSLRLEGATFRKRLYSLYGKIDLTKHQTLKAWYEIQDNKKSARKNSK